MQARLIPAQNVTFSNSLAWDKFWKLYGIGQEPQIDFKKYEVAGVFLGEKPNPGFGVEITSIKKKANKINVYYAKLLPDPNAGYIQVVVHPYDLVYFKRTEGEIIFKGSKRIRQLNKHS